jgi:hypothetical protein
MLKLYTFNISHFSEKARWALDYEGIAYEERVLLPGPHQLVTRRIARRTHVPVLEHDGQYVGVECDHRLHCCSPRWHQADGDQSDRADQDART